MKFHQIKNTFKINPIQTNTYHEKSITISDGFIFRTDKHFETIFRFMDILGLLYNLETEELIVNFYNSNNEFLLEKKISKLDSYNEIKINAEYVNGYRGIGVFYVYHLPKEKNTKIGFINRCYVGFKYNNKVSFHHGNSFVSGLEIETKKKITGFVKKSLLANWKYKIQKDFSKYDYSEILILNPLETDLKFFCNKKKYYLKKNCLEVLRIKKENQIDLTSNCTLLRPIIFSYRDHYFDVHHG